MAGAARNRVLAGRHPPPPGPRAPFRRYKQQNPGLIAAAADGPTVSFPHPTDCRSQPMLNGHLQRDCIRSCEMPPPAQAKDRHGDCRRCTTTLTHACPALLAEARSPNPSMSAISPSRERKSGQTGGRSLRLPSRLVPCYYAHTNDSPAAETRPLESHSAATT